VIKLFLFVALFFLTPLLANKVLYLNYDGVPKRVIQGEIFSVDIKTLSTVGMSEEIVYEFSNFYGLDILNDTPEREYRDKYIYDKFYFLATQSRAKLPDIVASLELEDAPLSDDINSSIEQNSTFNDIKYDDSFIRGSKLNVIALNPKSNFSNIIANNFELIDYKTTTYDNNHNIIVFVAKAQNCDISKLSFENVYKQGVESLNDSIHDSRITYFLVIDKRVENFNFSYFNLLKNRYISINIPIVVEDDSVATQTDLKPKDHSHNKIKAAVAFAIALVVLALAVIRRKYIYIVLIVIPLGYMIYVMIPSKQVCIKAGANIYLLPVKNGTIFEKTNTKYYLLEEGSVQDFKKVKLYNDKIGWVKNEDICSY
jgi:hypothetical protein